MEVSTMGFGERIKKLLNQKEMSQKELARRTGCTEAAISHYIKGDRIPRAVVLTKIAEVLDTTSEYIMDGTPVDAHSEIMHATKLIARNTCNMSIEEKRKILEILMGGNNE